MESGSWSWRRRLVARCVVAVAIVGLVAPSSLAALPDDDYAHGTEKTSAVSSADLDRFLPDRTGDFILPWESLRTQVEEGLGVAYLYRRDLADGRRLLWGCRWHSCMEKAAVIVSPAGEVEAVALINAGCHFTATPPRRLSNSWARRHLGCGDHKLTVFLHVTQAHRPAFEAWAEAVTGERLPVEVYWV